jgi:hypothetical protein
MSGMTQTRSLSACLVVACATLASGCGSTEEAAAPGAECGTKMVTYHDGSEPTRRLILVPPAPKLKAVALAPHEVEFSWAFEKLPGRCRPASVLLSVLNDPPYTPSTDLVRVTGKRGTHRMQLADFIPPPREALASALGGRGQRSRTVRALIER